MDWTRRRVLCAGSALVGGASTGCLADGSTVRYPETEASEADWQPLEGGTTTLGAASAPDDRGQLRVESPSNPELARSTDAIYRELRWFATEWEPTMEAYRTAVEEAIRKLDNVRRGEEFDDASLGEVRLVVGDVIERTQRLLGEHFAVHQLIGSTVDYHTKVLEKFTSRGDSDRALEELDRLLTFLGGVSTEQYVRKQMPIRPIQNRLFGWLRRTETRPVLFELYYSGTKFATYSYAGEHQDFLTGPFDGETKRANKRVFGALGVEEKREDYAFVIPHTLPIEKPLPPMPPEDHSTLEALPVYVQRFTDVQTATDAVRSLLEGRLTQEGYQNIGGVDWRRVYYRFDGDVTYAYLLQAGQYLLATAPSETAWEERVDWEEPIRRTWLWQPVDEEKSPTENANALRGDAMGRD